MSGQTTWKAWVRLGQSPVSGTFIEEVTMYDQSRRPGYHEAHVVLGPALPPPAQAEGAFEQALQPFIDVCGIYDAAEDDSHPIWIDATEREVRAITLGTFRKLLRASLPPPSGAGTGGKK